MFVCISDTCTSRSSFIAIRKFFTCQVYAYTKLPRAFHFNRPANSKLQSNKILYHRQKGTHTGKFLSILGPTFVDKDNHWPWDACDCLAARPTAATKRLSSLNGAKHEGTRRAEECAGRAVVGGGPEGRRSKMLESIKGHRTGEGHGGRLCAAAPSSTSCTRARLDKSRLRTTEGGAVATRSRGSAVC
jgi:hypothetical protein